MGCLFKFDVLICLVLELCLACANMTYMCLSDAYAGEEPEDNKECGDSCLEGTLTCQ